MSDPRDEIAVEALGVRLCRRLRLPIANLLFSEPMVGHANEHLVAAQAARRGEALEPARLPQPRRVFEQPMALLALEQD